MSIVSLAEAIVIRVSTLLNERNMTRYRLELTSGISHGHMQKIMMNKRKNITLKTVALLAKGFDMTLSEFLNDPLFNLDTLDLED